MKLSAHVLGPVAILLGALAAVPRLPVRAEPQQPPPPTFRGGTTFVRVDAYPRVDGKTVEGLRAEDFEVFEDGKLQPVETFEFIQFATRGATSVLRDPNSVAESKRQAADPNRRVFVVYLDIYHTTVTGSHEARAPVVEFLNRTIGPDDLFGMMTPEMPAQRLTLARRSDTIANELSKYWAWGEADRAKPMPRTAIERRLSDCAVSVGDADLEEMVLRRHREDTFYNNLEDLMSKLAALRDGRKNLLLLAEGWKPEGPRHWELAGRGRGEIPKIGIDPSGRLGRLNDRPGSVDQSWCSQQFARLGSLDFEVRFHQLLRTAQRSNVSIYPVDLGGLRLNSSAVSTLQILAENTDGLAVVNTNDLLGGVRKISDSVSSYYLLGYYSANTTADGRYREIKVRVKRPGVSVSARHGYFAPIARPASVPAAPVAAVDGTLQRAMTALARARPEAELYAFGARRADRADVVVELSSRELASGRWSKGASVEITLHPSGGDPVVVTGQIAPGGRSVLVTVPLSGADATNAVPVPMGVRVSGSTSLEALGEVASIGGQIVGEPLLFRATSSPRSTPQPVADMQYRRTERLHVEYPLLVAGSQARGRLLDVRGQALPIEPVVTTLTDGDAPLLTADLNLAPLTEGTYVLELTTTAGADTERRLLAFRVVR